MEENKPKKVQTNKKASNSTKKNNNIKKTVSSTKKNTTEKITNNKQPNKNNIKKSTTNKKKNSTKITKEVKDKTPKETVIDNTIDTKEINVIEKDILIDNDYTNNQKSIIETIDLTLNEVKIDEYFNKEDNINNNKVDNYISDIFEKDYGKQSKDLKFDNTTKIDEVLLNKTINNKTNNETQIKKINNINIFLMIIIVILLIVITILFLNHSKPIKKTKQEPIVTTEISVDENILFIGDSLTQEYNLDENFSYNKTVNNLKETTTYKILNNMKENIYIYNPSTIILMIGNDDYKEDIDSKNTIKNIKQIINETILNRNLSKIVVLPLFPNENNKEIENINDEIQEFCNDKEITYIDIYDEFIKEEIFNNNSLSTKGFQTLTTNLIPILNKE